MSDGASDKSSAKLPMIVVVVLAMLGVATFPQGGGKPSDGRPKAEVIAAGAAGALEVGGDEEELGPLATLRAANRLDLLKPDSSTPNPENPKSVSSDPPEKVSDAILRAEHGLRFLILLVPNPNQMSMSHEFDPTLSAALRAAESAGFLARRWSPMPGFPPTKKDASQDGSNLAAAQSEKTGSSTIAHRSVEKKSSSPGTKWPAAVLSIPTRNSDSHPSIKLLTLLVPESPTWGVDQERLASAIDLIDKHGRIHEKCGHSASSDHVPCIFQPIRIIGPGFSGSIDSLASVLKTRISSALRPIDKPRFIIYNGRSVSPDLERLKFEPKGAIHFKSTVYTNTQMASAFLDYLEKAPPFLTAPPRFAVLLESNTALGQAARQGTTKVDEAREKARQKLLGRAENFSFPLNISRIRDAYAAKGYFNSNEPMKLQLPDRFSPMEMAGQRGEGDLIPVVSPGPSAVGGELALSQSLLALERGRFNWAAISATNTYDRLFLAEKLRDACPDVRLCFMTASTLDVHHTATPYLRGTIVCSTYPLDPVSQTWTASPGWQDWKKTRKRVTKISFGNYFEEGIYNATVAHLSDLKLDKTPDLLDYAYPGATSETGAVPSVWISVIGQRSLYPLIVQKPDKDWKNGLDRNFPDLGGMYIAPQNELPPDEMTNASLDSSWITLLITSSFVSIVLSLWYLRVLVPVDETSRVGRWPTWAVASPDFRRAIDHHSLRKLAAAGASAALGQMILLSGPVWTLASRHGVHVSASLSLRILMIILSILALLGLGASSAVALFRMLFAERNRKIGLGESIYRVILAALALAQFALPFSLVMWIYFRFDAANLLLYLVRTTRLVNGVTPLMPFLLLGIAGAVVMIGDWRRGALRIWMNSTGEAPGLSSGPLSVVWSGFQETREALEQPLKAWRDAGFFATLPFWFIIALVGIFFDNSMPKDIEPYPMFFYSFILAFVVTLLLLVVRLVDLIGLLRRFDRLLRRLAEIPMVHAFDRIPAQCATISLWRLGASGSLAEDATNPRIDRQFEAVVVGYQSNLQAIRTERRLRFADLGPLDNLIRDRSGTGGLLPKQWWPAVEALTPLLAPFWAFRPAIPGPAGDNKKSSGDELADWPGVDNPELRTWLRSAEDLVAMVMVRQIAWLRASVQLTLSFIVVGLVITFPVLTSYPFEPQEPMYAVLVVLTMITVGTIVAFAVQASRDEVLSRLNKSPTDRFSFDSHFITTMITFVVPLLGLLGALSYSLSDLVRSLFEPFFRGS
jgi:hypothetical protein